MNNNPVHLVAAWSGKTDDETPLCGAKGPGVFANRTIYGEEVTCHTCLLIGALAEASRALTELDPLGKHHDATLIDEALKVARQK